LKDSGRAALSAIMPYVQSSVMTRVEYDEEASELDITFASGKTYRYRDVPLAIYVDLLDAASKGQFFNDAIKDAFAFAEVRGRKRRRRP
jgi:lysyl-tRNA synthetase class 2